MISFDKATDIGTTWTATSKTQSVAPTGTPFGVVVCLVENAVTSNSITAVTYGGQSLSLVGTCPRILATGETASISMWFLGSGIPTGTQDCVVTSSSSTTTKAGSVITIASNSSYNLTVQASAETVNSDSHGNVSYSLDPSGQVCLCIQINFSGMANFLFYEGLPNWTSRRQHDLGNEVYRVETRNAWTGTGTPEDPYTGLSSVACGWNQATDDALGFVAAIREVVPTTNTFTGGSAVAVAVGGVGNLITGHNSTAAITQKKQTTSGTIGDLNAVGAVAQKKQTTSATIGNLNAVGAIVSKKQTTEATVTLSFDATAAVTQKKQTTEATVGTLNAVGAIEQKKQTVEATAVMSVDAVGAIEQRNQTVDATIGTIDAVGGINQAKQTVDAIITVADAGVTTDIVGGITQKKQTVEAVVEIATPAVQHGSGSKSRHRDYEAALQRQRENEEDEDLLLIMAAIASAA